MAKDRYIEQIFPIKCCGRDARTREVLSEPVSVKVRVTQSSGDEKNISLLVECPYRTGGHGQQCKASYPPGVDKVGKGVMCPYRVEIP
jgi:hypothetical protein